MTITCKREWETELWKSVRAKMEEPYLSLRIDLEPVPNQTLTDEEMIRRDISLTRNWIELNSPSNTLRVLTRAIKEEDGGKIFLRALEVIAQIAIRKEHSQRLDSARIFQRSPSMESEEDREPMDCETIICNQIRLLKKWYQKPSLFLNIDGTKDS